MSMKMSSTGMFEKLKFWLGSIDRKTYLICNKYAKMGLEELIKNTPKDTGKTAESWTYSIKTKKDSIEIQYHNDNIQNGVNIAILLQYGHVTNNGGFVYGIDYVNPSLAPAFEALKNKLWEEVVKS